MGERRLLRRAGRAGTARARADERRRPARLRLRRPGCGARLQFLAERVSGRPARRRADAAPQPAALHHRWRDPAMDERAQPRPALRRGDPHRVRPLDVRGRKRPGPAQLLVAADRGASQAGRRPEGGPRPDANFAPEVFRATAPWYWSAGAQQNYRNFGLELNPASTGFSEVAERHRTALFALLAIAGLVLLIACANIAIAAGACEAAAELSMRMAIGASRWRLIRQLIVESLLLSGLGACGGFLLAIWGGRVLVGFISRSPLTIRPVDIDLSPDFRLLAFTAAAGIATALVFGLVPAFRATRGGLNDVLKERGRGTAGAPGRFRLGKGLAAAQVAVSFILLLAAGLFIGTLRNLLNADMGFRTGGVLLVSADARHAVNDPAMGPRVFSRILDRLRKLPGVVSVSDSYFTPAGEKCCWNEWISSDGYGASPRPDALLFLNAVSPDYFRTLGTPLVAGRDFDDHDGPTAPPARVINESAARQFFGSADPLGKTIRVGSAASGRLWHVVGVVKDAKYQRVDEPAPIAGFVAIGQAPYPYSSLEIELRHTVAFSALTPAVRAAIAEVGADITLHFRSFEAQVDESLQQQRLVAALSALFGALALSLSMVGLYGITAYSVARRRGEIGIRMALGARAVSVVWLVLRDVAVLLGIGTAMGALERRRRGGC